MSPAGRGAVGSLKQPPQAELSAARRQARPRAAQERLERIRRAEKELQPPADPRKDEAEKVGARVTDPEARVMRQGDGGLAPSYNVQISTEARHGVIVAGEVRQAQEGLSTGRDRSTQWACLVGIPLGRPWAVQALPLRLASPARNPESSLGAL